HLRNEITIGASHSFVPGGHLTIAQFQNPKDTITTDRGMRRNFSDFSVHVAVHDADTIRQVTALGFYGVSVAVPAIGPFAPVSTTELTASEEVSVDVENGATDVVIVADFGDYAEAVYALGVEQPGY